MLVLTRQNGEKLVIGNEIVIEVISVSGDGVRLGITAPREMSVHRYEIYAEIQAANRGASTPAENVSADSLEDLAALLRARQQISSAPR